MKENSQDCVKWVKTKDQLPEPMSLIVKRWKTGAVWAGIYVGTNKDSSFEEWCLLEHSSAESEP